jgi:pimeloyl-ACP methyl ester carboxylesterase
MFEYRFAVEETNIKCPVLVIASYKDKKTPIGITQNAAKKLFWVSDHKELLTFEHWLMTDEEFSEAPYYCLV